MDYKIYNVLAAFCLNLIHHVCSESILSCDPTTINDDCTGSHQMCDVASKQCICEDGYTLVYGDCEIPGTDYASTHNATATIISIFTVCLLVGGLVLIIRKYDLVEYMRRKINSRRNQDVMYEDVMIGQDDPPINA